MKVNVQPIPLTTTSSERWVKRGALVAFRAMRVVAAGAQKVPGVLAQAGHDVREAWQEAASPKA